MNKSSTRPKPEPQAAHGRLCRSWDEVAAEFERRTGRKMTRGNAFMIAESAIKKLRKRLMTSMRGGV